MRWERAVYAPIVHDLRVDLQQIVAAHPGFAWRTRSYDAAIRPRYPLCRWSHDFGVDSSTGALSAMSRAFLRQTADDVVQDDVAELAQETKMRQVAPTLPAPINAIFSEPRVASLTMPV